MTRRSHIPFVWTRLHLPVPTSLEAARASLTALAGLSGQPRIVLEVTGRANTVTWKLGCQAHQTSRVLSALSTQLPGLRSEPLAQTFDGLRADTAAAIRLPGGRALPLNQEATTEATRGLLGALSRTSRGELICVQIVLGPRRRPSRPAETSRSDATSRRAETAKHREHQFGCVIRVAASTQDPARSRSLIEGIIGALRSLEVPGLQLRVVRSSLRAFDEARSPYLWPTQLAVSDVLPFTGWPIQHPSDPRLPGVPSPHPRLLAPSKMVARNGRLLGTTTAAATPRPIALPVTDSLRHLHLLGPTGVGKSTVMAHLALADIQAGRGVVVIDPKGDLVTDLLARIPKHRLDDIVVLDPASSSPVGIQPLGGRLTTNADLAADTVLGVIHSLYADSWGPRTHDILHACLLTLARRGDASLVMVPLLLTNPGFRRSVIGHQVKADPIGLGSFWAWFEGISEAERAQAIAPLMNKLRPILLRPGIRAVLGQRRPKFELRDVFTRRRILLVSLGKGVIGAEAAQLLGSLVVSQLWAAALSRSAISAERRHPVMVHIDEVQDYLRLPGDLGDALAQARGLGVGFTLAHQHLAQLPTAVREAVMANARSRVAFHLTGRDARELAKLTSGVLTAEDFQALPAFQAYAQLLSSGTPTGWLSLTTQPLPAALRDPVDVRARSESLYGQPLDEIEADLLGLVAPDAGTADERLGRSMRAVRRDGDRS